MRKNRINCKKGVSPLIATVLLIAFAVALGAVVMNWGSAYVKTTQEQTKARYQKNVGCTSELEFKIVKISGEPLICQEPDKLRITIENGPYMTIEDLQVFIIGENAIKKEIIENFSLSKADIRKFSIDYDTNTHGVIQQVRLIPVINIEETKSVCSQRALIVNRLRDC